MAETRYPLSLVIRAVDNVTKPLQAINSRLEKTGARLSAPFQKLGASLGALSSAAGIPKIAESFRGVGTAAGEVGSRAAQLGTLLAGIGAAGAVGLYSLVRSSEAAGSRLNDLSNLTGLSVNAFAQLEFAAKQAGVENDAFAGGMEKFNKALSEARRNTGPLAALLSKVGPEYLRQLKGVKSNEEGFNLLAKAMGKIQDPGKRAELAAAAFGKAGLGMVNVLKDGPVGVDALRQTFARLAGDQSTFAKNFDALGDAFDNLELAGSSLRNVVGGALAPSLTNLAEVVTGFIVANRDGLQLWATKTGGAIQKWVDGGGVDRLVKGLGELKDTVSGAVDKVGGLGNALGLVAVAMAGPTLVSTGKLGLSLLTLGKDVLLLGFRLGTVLVGALGQAALGLLAFNFGPLIAGLSGAIASVWSFTAALLANPITWVVVAVAALAGAVYFIYKNWEPIKAFFSGVWDSLMSGVSTTLAWVGENLGWTPLGMLVNNWEPVKTFFSDLWNSITEIFTSAWGTIKPIVDGMMAVAEFTPIGGLMLAGASARESLFGGGGAASALGAARALPPAAGAGGDARVQVDFVNLPRGVRVTPTRDNTAALDMNLGYSMVGP